MRSSPDAHPFAADSAHAIATARWLGMAWLGLTVLSTVTLMMPGALPNGGQVSFDRALFVASGVGTLTGFDLSFARLADFTPLVRMTLFLQTCAAILMTFVGGGGMLLRVLRSDLAPATLAIASLGLLVLAGAAGVATRGLSLDAAWQGVATLGNLSTTIGEAFGPEQASLWLIYYPLAIAGAIGPLALLMLARKTRNIHAGGVLQIVTLRFLLGLGVFTLMAWILPTGFRETLRNAAIQTLGAYGFAANLLPLTGWPRGSEWPTLALILIGVGTAGTTGGFGAAWLLTLPRRCTARILPFIGWYGLTILVGLTVLARSDATIGGERLVAVVIGASSNVGISHVPISLTGPGLVVLSGCMVAGRLLPLLALAALLDRPQPRSASTTD